MSTSNWNSRYYCKDADGRDLFFVELFMEEGLESINFNSSLFYNILQHRNIEKIVNQLTDENLDVSKRYDIVNLLFKKIQSIPGIGDYYFGSKSLNKEGQYIPEYVNFLQNFIQNNEFPDVAVFSRNINGYHFEYCLPLLQDKINKGGSKKTDKSACEDIIKLDVTLSNEYVEWYSNELNYFNEVLDYGQSKYDCFLITQKLQIKLFFIRKVVLD